MKEFVMIFRSESLPEKRFSPDEMQEMMKAWQNWMGGMAAQDKLASSGNRLGGDGRSVKPGNVVTNGPFVELKEIISGYIVVRADSIQEAAEMAKGCPMVIGGGGFVEVRDVVPMNG
ncbi:MAG TPA: YciI family protein [Mucilaginibacter sp.]|jgi:hypothetical protein